MGYLLIGNPASFFDIAGFIGTKSGEKRDTPQLKAVP
jgi:hypothetical protein